MSIACLLLPRLAAEVEQGILSAAGRPVAVYRRGRIVSVSGEAEAAGLQVGQRVRTAEAVSAEVELVPFAGERYEGPWCAALDACAALVSTVEPVELGQAFLDLHGAGEPARAVAEIEAAVRGHAGLSGTVGAGSSKLVARIAAELCPSRAVGPDEAAAFLAPLPLTRLWVLEEGTMERLQALGVSTIGLLQQMPLSQLREAFGTEAGRLHRLSRGVDHAAVAALYPPPTVEVRQALPGGVDSTEVLRSCLRQLAAELAERLARREQACSRIALRLELEEGGHASRSLRLRAPCAEAEELGFALQRLLDRVPPPAPVTLVAVRVGELSRCTARQLDLFTDTGPRRGTEGAAEVLDAARRQFGTHALALGTEVEVPRRERMLAALTRGV